MSADRRLYVTQCQNLGSREPEDKFVYRVEKVVNATEPHVGQILKKAEVDDLAELESWTVTITGSKKR